VLLNVNGMTLEQYLIDVGIRAFEYESEIDNVKRELLKDNVEYFKKCYEKGLSAYKANLFLYDYVNEDYVL